MKRRLSSIAAVAAIGLVAGCGGSSSTGSTSTQGFGSAFASATAQLKRTAVSIGTAVKGANGQTNSQIQSTFRNLANEWQSDSAKLDSLHPPAAATTDFDALKSASSSVESDLNAIAAAAGANDVAVARAATIKLVRDILAAKSAAQRVQNETS